MENSSTNQISAEGGLRLNGIFKPSRLDETLVTIITATFNRKDFLEDTIQSVINQTYRNIEYIIIDGGSTDGTLDVIQQYDDKIDYWISRADNTMYEAINDGIRLATGNIVAILNSDDKYVGPNVIEQVVAAFKKFPHIDGLYGDLIRLQKNNIRYKKLFQVNYRQYLVSGKGTFVPHTALFITRECIEKVGLYDTRYRYASDYDFILRCLKNGRLKYISCPFTFFREHDKSITATDSTITPETTMILKAHKIDCFNKWYCLFLYTYLWSKYKLSNLLYAIRKSKLIPETTNA